MKIVVYGTSTCIWCERALELLNSKNIRYEYCEIDTNPRHLSAYRVHFPTKKTVPQILGVEDDGGESWGIGGYDDLVKYLS